MVMESQNYEFSDYINGFTLVDDNILANGYRFKDESVDLSFLDHPSPAPNSNYAPDTLNIPSGPDEFADCVSKYLNEILEEDNTESKLSMIHDPLALQATEKSLYEALGEKYPPFRPPPLTVSPNIDSPEEIFLGSSSEYSINSSRSGSNSTDNWLVSDFIETRSSVTQTLSPEYPSFWPFGSTTSVTNNVDSMINAHMVQNIFTDSESILQFKRGMEEASKFLPPSKPLVIDLDQYDLPSDSIDASLEIVLKTERDVSPNGSRGRKHYQLEDNGYEEQRSSKQSAISIEETELSEMFDRVLLCTDAKGESIPCYGDLPYINNKSQPNGQSYESNNGYNDHSWRQNETVDVRTMLVNCAQSVAADDHMTATEQLRQIRHHASSSGDASQRLADIFATGLEARLSGTGSQLYATKTDVRVSTGVKLKAFQVYLSACPFMKNAIFFANKTICKAASSSSTVHIVDFGIAYGFQWPILIKHLSERIGGPPKLRITGIELPEHGFRPAEKVEETGRRLANYCQRFNVPFEYNAIATQNWDTIKIGDLKLQRNEFLAVNTVFRFKNLPDETIMEDNPRDGVLKLIRNMKPDVFIHAVLNGSYNAPFFVTRFREAVFHYSALFDMFDATLDRENEQRLEFEKEFYGREAMNVIACEGAERVERPETYKQWQARNSRAGFRQKSLDKELISELKCKVKAGYHKDFVFDEDGKWMLQGWKGRILYASSCWVAP